MSGGLIALLIGVGLLSAIVAFVGLGAVITWVKKKAGEVHAELARLIGDEPVVHTSPTHFWGVESRGPAQARGNGRISLTPTRVVFVQGITLRTVVFARDAIEAVDTTSSHLGKYQPGRRALRIKFKTETGTTDVGVWVVPDVDVWLSHLKTS